MKKLPGLLLLVLIAVQPGCKKNNDQYPERAAHVRFGGDPIVDGIGYYIQLDSSREVLIPINLSSEYRHRDVDAAVAVRVIDVAKRFYYGFTAPVNPGLRGVYIVTIRNL